MYGYIRPFIVMCVLEGFWATTVRCLEVHSLPSRYAQSCPNSFNSQTMLLYLFKHRVHISTSWFTCHLFAKDSPPAMGFLVGAGHPECHVWMP